MWTQAYMWWVRVKRVSEAGGPAVSRKTWHPQPDWERNLQLSGTHDAWGTGQTDLMPCLGQQDSFFNPIRWWKSHTYTAALGCLWLQVQTGLSLWEIPPVPAGGWCGKGGTAEWKMSVMEDRLHWKDTNNAAESHSIRLQCKSAIYRA